MAFKQLVAAFGVLAFLGIMAVVAISVLVIAAAKLISEKRLADYSRRITDWLFGGRGFTVKILVVAVPLGLVYSVVLVSASLASQETTLSPGAEKYFCEIDCHLAYSVTEARTAPMIGAGPDAVKARGRFIIVGVRTRFDETTISQHRGNGPLVPSPREILILDGAGNRYHISETGEQALASSGDVGVSMMEPLRPGESYVSRLVFDVPPDLAGPRLLIGSPTNPRWIGGVLIGNEESVLHKKVFLALGSAPAQ
ncbi:MAG TPA: hypothetical protein VGZ48_00770 [Candidatus Acidoferrales bacterium]|jgi:hypothetical protein|nr:hypothetical protein [Candidatus Acidoferrales bacterium]